jgi:hypothetical protein
MTESVEITYEGKLTPELSQKLGMSPDNWFRNVCLWQFYKENRNLVDGCSSHEELLSKGVLPAPTKADSENLDLESF